MHFLITWTGSWLILSLTKMQIRKGKIVFNSLLLGSGSTGVKTYEETVSGLRCQWLSLYRLYTTEYIRATP